MGEHKPETKLRNLIRKHLPEAGIIWRWSEDDLQRLLVESIDKMPEPIADAMERYYILDQGPEKDEVTGKMLSSDSMFYQYLQDGRAIVVTIIRLAMENPQTLERAAQIVSR